MSADSEPQPKRDGFDHGQTLLGRRDLLRRSAIAGTTLAAGGAASSGTVAADWWTPEAKHGDGDTMARQVEESARWLYDSATGLFSSGYDKEEVQDMVATNQHWEIYESFDDAKALLDGFHTETNNWTVPSDPTQSALADLAWGEARAYTFRQIEEQGDDVAETEVVNGAIQKANEYLSTVARNYIRQWNEYAYIIHRHALTFFDESNTSSSNFVPANDPNHVKGEVAQTPDEYSTDFVSRIEFADTPEGLSGSDVFQQDTGTSVVGFGMKVNQYTLPNGETEPVYETHSIYPDGAIDQSITAWSTQSSATQVLSPDGDSIYALATTYNGGPEPEWPKKIEAVEAVETQVNGGELETYISNILVEVRQEELEPIEILSPADYAREFGDAEGITRLDAEMTALGLQAPADAKTERTLVWTDADGNERTETGVPYLSWNWTTLESWEYEYDSTAHVLTVDQDSISQDGVIDITYDDSNSTTVSVDMNNLDEEGSIDVSADAPTGANVASIALDLAGELNSFWPEGETITVGSDGQAESLILGYENDDGNFTRETITGDVTLEDAGDGDRMQLEGYNTRTRDPARALELAKHYEEQRKDTTDLEEEDPWTPPPLFDGGSGGLLLLAAGAIAAFVLSNNN